MPGSSGSSTESTVMFAKGLPSSSDIFVSGATGPFVWDEMSSVAAKGLPSSADTFFAPGTTYVETSVAFGKVFVAEYNPGGGNTYTEATVALGAGLPVSRDRGVFLDSTFATLLGIPGGTDEYDPAGGNTYFEYTEVIGIGILSTADLFRVSDIAISQGKGHVSSAEAVTYTIGSTTFGKGLPVSGDVAVFHHSSVGVGRGLPASRDLGVYDIDSVAAGRGALSGVSVFKVVDRAVAAAKGLPSTATAAVTYTEGTSSLGKGFASGSDQFKITDRATMRAAGLPASRDPWEIDESGTAIARGVPHVNDGGRIYLDHAVVFASPRMHGADIAVFLDRTSALAAGVPIWTPATVDPSGLIPAIRANVAAVLTDLTEIPEGLPSEGIGSDLALDFLAIVAGTPTQASGFAVQDQGVWVPIDLVYVTALKSGEIQVSQRARADLVPLRRRLTADHVQRGRDGVPTCDDLRIVATPYDLTNQYQKHFAATYEDRAIHVQVLSIECLQVHRTYEP